MVGHRRGISGDARQRRRGYARAGAVARQRAVHRSGDRRETAARGDVPLLAQRVAAVASNDEHHRGADLLCPASPVRAADAARHRQSRRVPREPGKCCAYHRAVETRRRDWPRRARTVRHAARSGVDAASEKPSRSTWIGGVEDQPRPAQPACLVAIAVRSARQRARSARAALRAETDALAGTRHRVLPVDAFIRARPRRHRPTAA